VFDRKLEELLAPLAAGESRTGENVPDVVADACFLGNRCGLSEF
jgi:hypothetical protein